MKKLFDFVYGNFMTLFNRVVENLRELSSLYQVALALVAVALIFIAVMILIYLNRYSKYRTIKKIENVDIVLFNSVWEFEPYKRAKEGEILFILIIPFTFLINFVVKVFMFRAFSAINSSDYITRRMLENMQLENMRLKDKNKELLKTIDDAGLNRKQRPQPKPVQRTQQQVVPKEEPKKEVKEEVVTPEKEPEKESSSKQEEIVKETPKKEAAVNPEIKEEVETSSTIVKEDDKEPEVILAAKKVEEPKELENEIIEAEIIDPENENIDDLMEDVAAKETRGRA